MFGRGVIFTALAAYLAVVGCVVWPSGPSSPSAYDDAGDYGGGYDTPRNTPNGGNHLAGSARTRPPRTSFRGPKYAGLPYRGVAMQIQRVDLMAEYERGIDEVAA